MKSKTFFDHRHASAYLVNSVIRKGPTPILVTDVMEADEKNKKWRLNYIPIGSSANSILFLPSTEVNMNPVPLGMINAHKQVVFASRIPTRGWKVGLYEHNVYFRPLALDWGETAPELLRSKYLRDTILGKYPDFDKVIKDIRAGHKMKAFSRRFAVIGGSLMYKSIGNAVGVAERTGPVLFENFNYLTEVLQEDLNG